jgi:hypothetical protein
MTKITIDRSVVQQGLGNAPPPSEQGATHD